MADSRQAAQRRLPVLPRVDTHASGQVQLKATGGAFRFEGARPAPTAGFDRTYLGPVLVVRNGPLVASVLNTWSEPITVHWHGMLVPGEQDGGPHSLIAPGETWAPAMQIEQPPATLWYHSHVHGQTAKHVHTGLAGAIHVTDGRDDDRGLPSEYGADDLTLLIQDRRSDASGRMVYAPTPTDILNGFHGSKIFVNGRANAIAVVPPGLVRLRLVNASNARTYVFSLDDSRPMHLVATDGGYLDSPVDLRFMRLSPGERAEVLVNFAEGPAPVLLNTRGLSQRILEFAVDQRLKPRITTVPDDLGDRSAALAAPVRTRQFSLNMGGNSLGERHVPRSAHGQSELGAHDFGINGRPFAMDRIDFEVALGSVERWIVRGGGGVDHPFHVHGVHFRVLRNGGVAPRREESGWKDTVLVNGQAELLVPFTRLASPTHPYMYHCHILEHEDAGMMGQFVVI